MEAGEAVLLFLTALLAGAMNSVAGGGSFFTFPMLIFTGMPSVAANATNTMALWPGALASVGAYRKELTASRHILLPLVVISLIGGWLGATVLLKTPEHTFNALIPYLLLAATLLFYFSPRITAFLKQHQSGTVTTKGKVSAWGVQLLIATYGGYFGGGMGILMLSMLSLMGLKDIHQMNGLKTLLATSINAVAVGMFILAGIIVWPQALLMMTAAIIGGYGGAAFARKIPQIFIRRFIVTVGLGLSLYFFLFG